ncbi:MAG TPA: M56 family metallopeptidase [Bryobacteraceae bacterium]|nr:M56 family metallopeptidase [Bryobacteraceae bacterium]
MNAVQILASEPWVERLGMTLLHFLWQGLLIAALYAAARRMARTSTPHTRYLFACGALAAMMAAPLVTWELLQPSRTSLIAADRIRTTSPPALTRASPVILLPGSVRATVSAVQPEQFLSWVVIIWLAGATVFWVRLAGGWMISARMRSSLVRRAPPEWQATLRTLAARIGLSRPVRLLVSALVQTPAVVGWLRPVVLVPVGALGGLPPEHVEALLLHELAHIRRHDYLINLLQGVAESLLFYHPVVWWISRHIRVERELCCDDIAVSVSGDAFVFARALEQLESYRPLHRGVAVAANDGSLANRIARLLGQPRPQPHTRLGTGWLATAILLAAAAYALFAQSATRPAFQSLSIKPSTVKWNERAHHPMGVGVNSSLLLLIQFAYATHNAPYAGHTIPLPASQIAGGPPWINSEGWDIAAKSPADPNQLWTMWQALLADRFKLRLHRETRERPIYVMTAAENGLKLPTPRKDLGCVSFPAGTKPHQVPGKVDCGYVSGPGSGFGAPRGELGMRGRKVHIDDLISELALVLDRPISDRTGFTGEFDVDLHFAPDQALQGFGFGSGEPAAPKAPVGPNIFAALEQQLGLKLAPAKGPVEVLVIDHAERPAAN